MQQLNIHIRPILPFLFIWIGSTSLTVFTLLKLFGPFHIIINAIIFGCIVYCGRLLSKRLIDGKLVVSISNEKIHFNWSLKPLLTNLILQEFTLDSILDYKLYQNQYSYILIIYLKNGNMFKINGKTMSKNDDIKKLVKRLKHAKYK